MKLLEFTKLTGYSPVTVAQALLYKPERRAAKLATAMGVSESREDLVKFAVSKKARRNYKQIHTDTNTKTTNPAGANTPPASGLPAQTLSPEGRACSFCSDGAADAPIESDGR